MRGSDEGIGDPPHKLNPSVIGFPAAATEVAQQVTTEVAGTTDVKMMKLVCLGL